jgi:hypothetical protein
MANQARTPSHENAAFPEADQANEFTKVPFVPAKNGLREFGD